MRRMIGFMTSNDPKSETPSVPSTIRSITPVKSLVKVRFECHSMPLAYYNDRFDLQEGDVVYVSGKLAGEPGVVVSVTTKFRIHTSDYERVLSLLDLTIHGSFTGVRDKMVSFDQISITPEQFAGWVTPPEDPKKKKDEDEDEDEVVSGEGYSIDINNIEACEDITSVIAERAVGYCTEGRVRYLCVQNGVGRAYVEGTKWYRVDFHFNDGMMTDIYCDCPYSALCKHEVAVAIMDAPDDEGIIRQRLIQFIQKWGHRYPGAGYGLRFSDWLDSENPQTYNSWGNGSAMRVSSVAWLYDDLDTVRRMARLSAEVTHNHPEGIKGAEAIASAIFLARTGSSKAEIKAYVEKQFGYDLSRTCDEIRPDYHHVESCQETIPEAITAFLEGESFENVIRTAVSLGGDCDTLTCIAGSIAEGYHGVQADMKQACWERLPADLREILSRFDATRLQLSADLKQ